MSLTWNPEQAKAIASPLNHLVIIASAGAGKTEVIVQRYLRYVTEHGFSPSQILAVTYTYRAAASMKQRICRILRDQELYDAAQEAETGPIQTIHSFYERILRENSVWSGLNPDFEIVSESEADRLWDLSLRLALTQPEADQPEVKKYRQQTAGKRRWKGILDLDTLLRSQVVHDIIQPARSQGLTYAELEESFTTIEQVNLMVAKIISDPAWPTDPTLTIGAKAQHYSKPSKEHLVGNQLDVEVDLFLGLMRLAVQTWHNYETELAKRSQLDFSMLEQRALNLLDENPTLASRIRHQFQVILLDESQDANHNQFRFLKSLSLNHSLSVGDQKQSIYGFRGSALQEFERQIDDNTIKLELNYRSQPGIINFVNHLFHNQWGNQYDPMNPGKHAPINPLDFSGVELLESESTTAASRTANFIHQMIKEGTKLQDIVILTQGRRAMGQIQSLLTAKDIPSEAAGTTDSLFTRMEARDMANLLTCCVHPTSNYYLACLLHSPYVGLSLDSIILLGQSQNIFDQLAEFDYPMDSDKSKIQEFLSWFTEIRAFCDRFSAYEIINQALKRSPYLANLGTKTGGEQNIANARKLLVLATRNPELTPLQLADRFRHLQAVAQREPLAPLHDPDAEVVRLMTIHKSKGLEFPNVIVHGHDLNDYKRNQDIITDFRNQAAFTKFKGKNVIHDQLKERLHQAEMAEKMRLLYVACTRAESRLILGIRPPNSKAKNNLLTQLLLKPLPRSDYAQHNVRLHPAP
jgi:ATP-dependent helicase/nuclease subunit A